MFSVKSKLNMWDLFVGMFFSQWAFPNILLWLAILTFNFYHQALPLLHQGLLIHALALMLIYFLRLVLIMVGVVAFFMIVGTITGNLRSHFLLQEYTFDGTTITDKADGLEQKNDLKSILNVYEDKKRFILFKSGFKAEVISKKMMTGEEAARIREFFKPKALLVYKWFLGAFPWAVLGLTALTLWLVFLPIYYQQTSANPMMAYWTDSELLVGIQKGYTGYQRTLFQELFPAIDSSVDKTQVVFETKFIDIKDGAKNETTLSSPKPFFLRPNGTDLYCLTGKKGKRIGWKLTGGKFVSLTPAELASLKEPSETPAVSPWNHFNLWDENDQEIESQDPMNPEDDLATFRVKPQTLQIHYQKTTMGRDVDSILETYSLKGMGPGNTETLLDKVESSLKTVSAQKYKGRFPPGSDEEGQVQP